MASLHKVVEAYMYLQRNINEPEISKLTTKKGRITIPLFKMMSFVDVKDEGLLLQYERFIREDAAADAFRSTVELLTDISPRGVKRKFTFELLIENNAQLLLAGYSSPPIVDPVVENQTPPPIKQVRVSGKTAFTQAYISRHSLFILSDTINQALSLRFEWLLPLLTSMQLTSSHVQRWSWIPSRWYNSS